MKEAEEKRAKKTSCFFILHTPTQMIVGSKKKNTHFRRVNCPFFSPPLLVLVPLWENMARLLYRNDLTNYLKVSKLSVINDEIKNASLLYIFAYTTKREREKKKGEFDECETEEVPKNEIIFDFLPDSLPSSYIASHLSNVCMYIYTHCSWDIYRHAQRPPLTPRWRY